MKQLRVTIDKQGAAIVAVECGVVGTACADLTRRLEQALGSVTTDTELPEMYATVEQEVKA